MLTRCPECNTTFRVTADQLAMAGGRVRCGRCSAIFDARRTMVDLPGESTAATAERTQATPEPSTSYVTDYSEFLGDRAAEPGSKAPTRPAAAQAADHNLDQPAAPAQTPPAAQSTTAEATSSGTEPTSAEQTPTAALSATAETIAPDTEPAPAEQTPPAALSGRDKTTPPGTEPASAEQTPPAALSATAEPIAPDTEPATAEQTPPADAADAADQTEVDEQTQSEPAESPPAVRHEPAPDVLADDLQALRRKRSMTRTLTWTTVIVALALLLGAQVTYVMRDNLARYPVVRPWLARMCASLGCAPPLHRNLAKLRMLSSHINPQTGHPDVLSVHATMVNTADYPQPYPVLQLQLSNLQGQIIGMRRFRPVEYLSPGTDLRAGMPAQTPISVHLALVSPGERVTGYQFNFR